MATKLRGVQFDVSEALERASVQFRGLNPKEPGQWPFLPRLAAWVVCSLLVVVLGWVLLLSAVQDDLQARRAKEPELKQTYTLRLSQAINLGELRKQKLQVQEYVAQLERQLPGKAEMDALLSDINQAGLGRGLLFELFRPGQVVVKDYYAELPIALRVTGRYHDIGAFAADISSLSRIVTLHDLAITQAGARDGGVAGPLTMEATARTYRYLDTSEAKPAPGKGAAK